eukprot:COSAG01_NODE_12064_length_1806_cov_1.121265_2_plen_163_part_00
MSLRSESESLQPCIHRSGNGDLQTAVHSGVDIYTTATYLLISSSSTASSMRFLQALIRKRVRVDALSVLRSTLSSFRDSFSVACSKQHATKWCAGVRQRARPKCCTHHQRFQHLKFCHQQRLQLGRLMLLNNCKISLATKVVDSCSDKRKAALLAGTQTIQE